MFVSIVCLEKMKMLNCWFFVMNFLIGCSGVVGLEVILVIVKLIFVYL